VVPTLAVLYVKSIYLAAVDVIRADDAHPNAMDFSMIGLRDAVLGEA
jgi:hypothetical protein